MIKFFNIRTGKTRKAETEPHISAFWASSDRGPNAHRGQDFGWRLAPETVVELERIQNDSEELHKICDIYDVLLENINEYHILKYISDKNDKEKTGEKNSEKDFSREYEKEIRQLKGDDEGDVELKSDIMEEDEILSGLKRSALNELAEKLGVESPSEFKNSETLIEAIKVKKEEKK